MNAPNDPPTDGSLDPSSNDSTENAPDASPEEALVPALNARLQEMGNAAGGAERSLTAARRALGEIRSLCDTQLDPDADADAINAAKSSAARADVSLEAVAAEIIRIGKALDAVAGLEEE